MQKFIVAACLFSSVLAYADPSLKLPANAFISKYEWDSFLSSKLCAEDLVILRDGTRLCGKMEKIPPISYSFGNLLFSPEEVAAMAITRQDNALKLQYITRDGQNYMGNLSRGAFVFNVHQPIPDDPSNYIKREIDPEEIHFALLRERDTLNTYSRGSISSIDLRNGDYLPAILQDEVIVLTDGWNELYLKPNEILELSFNGGLHGRILENGLPRQLNFMFVKQQFITVRIPKNGQSLKLPWDQIDFIEAHNGGFKSSSAHDLAFKDLIDEPKTPMPQTMPEAIGNNSGTLLDGASAAVTLEPAAFVGFDLLGMELLQDPTPMFNPEEEHSWQLEIAFEELESDTHEGECEVAMLDKELFQEIAEALVYEDVKRVDVDPAPFDVQPVPADQDVSKRPAHAEPSKTEPTADMDLPVHEMELEHFFAEIDLPVHEMELEHFFAEALADIEEEQDVAMVDAHQPQPTSELTAEEQEIIQMLFSDEPLEEKEEEQEKPNPREKMAFVAAEEMFIPITYRDQTMRGIILPTQGEPTLLIRAESFYIDPTPITNKEYAAFISATNHIAPLHWIEGDIPEGHDQKPVVNVSYNDAAAYAAWVGKRLPSEMEWTRALQAGAVHSESVYEWTSTASSANSKVIFLGTGFQPRNENWFDHTTGFRTAADGEREHQ